jgi:hypothetical protein
MYEATKAYADAAAEAVVPFTDIRVEKVDDDLKLVGRTGVPATLTHYAFGQISGRAGAPANYLRTLPATLAAQNINHGLAVRSDRAASDAKLLFHRNSGLVLRALTTERYERLWNYELVGRLQDLLDEGWVVPPARPALPNQPGTRLATEADVLAAGAHGLSVRVGDEIAPAGLYASDHDMFAFLVYEKNRIANGTPNGLARGVFYSNSEVGNNAVYRMSFLYESVCGNHIVWNVSNLKKLRIVHSGQVRNKLQLYAADLVEYANRSASEDEAIIKRAQHKVIAATKQDVIDELFRLRVGLTQTQIGDAYDLAEQHEQDANAAPNTVYGMVHGLTRLSQGNYADERNHLDAAAGKVMRIAF